MKKVLAFEEFLNEGTYSKKTKKYDIETAKSLARRIRNAISRDRNGTGFCQINKVDDDKNAFLSIKASGDYVREDIEKILNESTQLNEGGISNLYVLAKESKNLQDFIKKALDVYEMLKDDKSTRDFLEEIYNEGVNENVNEGNNAKDFAFEISVALHNLSISKEVREDGSAQDVLNKISKDFKDFRTKFKF